MSIIVPEETPARSLTRRATLAAVTLLLTLQACDRSPGRDAGPGSQRPAPLGPGIVSLAPAIDDTLRFLGRGELLVGISDYSQSFHELPRVGTILTPSLESIARLRPGLILATWVQGADEATLKKLAPTQLLPWLTPAEIASSIEMLGRLSQSETQAHTLAERFRALPAEPPKGARSVLLLLPSTGQLSELWFLRKNSVHGAVLHQAGAKNAIDHPVLGAASLSVEELLRANPEGVVILTSAASSALAHELAQHLGELEPLAAARARRIRVVTTENPLGVGPEVLGLAPRLRDELKSLALLP